MRKKYIIQVLIYFVIGLGCKKDVTNNDWKQIKIDYTGYLSDIDFTDNANGYIVGDYDFNLARTILLKTVDGGETWQIDTFRVNKVKFFGIYADAAGTLYASGNSLDTRLISRDRIYKSIDKGQSWSLIDTLHTLNSQTFHLFNPNEGILVFSQSFFATNDSGNNFSKVYESQKGFSTFNHLQFVNNKVGYATGGISYDITDYGIIAKSIDGGKSWTNKDINISNITGSFFIDSAIGYIFTFSRQLYKTTDGGESWNLINTNVPAQYTRCYFKSETEGYIADLNRIHYTNDGGKTWLLKLTVNSSDINGITGLCFTKANSGFVIGREGQILKLSN